MYIQTFATPTISDFNGPPARSNTSLETPFEIKYIDNIIHHFASAVISASNPFCSCSPTSPCQPCASRYSMNAMSSSARSLPVMSGTNAQVTKTPVTPQMAAMMNVQLKGLLVNSSVYVYNAPLAQVILNGGECLSPDSGTRLAHGSTESITGASNRCRIRPDHRIAGF